MIPLELVSIFPVNTFFFPNSFSRLDLRRMCTPLHVHSGRSVVGYRRFPRNSLPRLDFRRPLTAMRIWTKGIRFDGIRRTGKGVCLLLWYKVLELQFLRMIRLPAVFPFQQIHYPAPDKAPASDSGVFDSVAAIIAGLSPLAGFPQLTAQALCAIIQTAPEKLPGDRLPLLLRLLVYRFLFLDLCDSFTSRTKKRAAKAALSSYCADPACSENFVDMSWYSRVFFGKLFINGTMVLPHLMRPLPKSTLVM